jgi:hypothetical protein
MMVSPQGMGAGEVHSAEMATPPVTQEVAPSLAPPVPPKAETKPIAGPTFETKPAEPKPPETKVTEPKPIEPAPPKIEPKEVEKPAEPRAPVKPAAPAVTPPATVAPPVIAPAPPAIPDKPVIAPPKATEPAAPIPAAPGTGPAPAPVPANPLIPAAPANKAPDKPKDKDDPFGANNDTNTFRQWTDASGQYRIEARFVSFIEGTVRLQKADGRYVRIRYELLSSTDQAYVAHQDGSQYAME